eukprot:781419-Pyramimonas_sp.AAC.1
MVTGVMPCSRASLNAMVAPFFTHFSKRAPSISPRWKEYTASWKPTGRRPSAAGRIHSTGLSSALPPSIVSTYMSPSGVATTQCTAPFLSTGSAQLSTRSCQRSSAA